MMSKAPISAQPTRPLPSWFKEGVKAFSFIKAPARAGDLSDYEATVLTSLAKFHGYSLEEVEEKYAQFEDLTLKIMGNVQEAIESRLKRLVADGISVDRIRIEQRPDGSTAIVVDSIPDSSFRITYADDPR